MKNKMLLFVMQLTMICITNFSSTYAGSITPGDTAAQIQPYHQVFHKNGDAGEIVQGFVRLGAGFTVLPDAMGTLDTRLSVSGAMDLRETGTLQLLSDLYLDSNVSLSSGGKIKAHGNTIFMSGDLTLPPSKVLHFMNNAVVDGRNHSLIVDTNSQIFMDTAVSVTLKNMTIKNKRNATTYPPLRLAAQTTQLTLDNVIMAPINDFSFPQGQMFINNDVMFTGTSAFIYQSTKPCYINSESCLYFDHNTTFSFAPACNDKNLIVLTDPTSTLYLDGCDLKTTYTGIRLTTGRLICDNKVIFDSQATFSISGFGEQILKTGENCDPSTNWSPDGRFLAVGTSSATKIFRFDGTTISNLSSASYGATVFSVNWSLDGKYLAAGGNSNGIRIYSFNGATLSEVISARSLYGGTVYSVNWSPDGKYLAVGGNNSSNDLSIYSFDCSILILKDSKDYGVQVKSVNWSPDGKYLAVGGQNSSSDLSIYSFDGSKLSADPIDFKDYGNYVDSVNWSPDGKYLVVGGNNGTSALSIYSFDGASLSDEPVVSKNFGSQLTSVNWSPDGKYLAIGGRLPSSGNELQVYSFNGSTLSLVDQKNYGAYLYSFTWRPDGKYLAVGGEQPDAGHSGLEIYPVTFVKEPTPQTMNNGIIFGNKNAGSLYNLQTTLLSGCNIKLKGLLNDDSV